MAQNPYEQAVTHLKHGEYEQAIHHFTTAIELDPNSPNAYVGRALAHRSLGNDESAVADEETARRLGGAERSTWQRLVNRANKQQSSRRRDLLQEQAVLLWQFTQDVSERGFVQWLDEDSINDLVLVVEQIGTPSCMKVREMLEELRRVLEAIWDIQRRYDSVEQEFCEEVEAWIEEQSQSEE